MSDDDDVDRPVDADDDNNNNIDDGGDNGNTTNCNIPDPGGSGFNDMVQLSIAADGLILQLSIHGMMKALVG